MNLNITPEWILRMAQKEDGCITSVGGLGFALSAQVEYLWTTDRITATFSPCRKYRYTLIRRWGEDWQTNTCMFLALNPSTADEVQDDPTVRRCINYAKDWGYSGLCVTNIFAFRSTAPAKMMVQEDPIGPDNDFWINECAQRAKIVVAAWGNHGLHRDRASQIRALVPNLYCLKVTGAGMPGHPLYLRKNLEPIPYAPD